MPARTVTPGELKFCYSYFALYGDPLLEPRTDPYPEGYLAHLAQTGVTGVWLQAVLYRLAPFPWELQRSTRYRTRLKNLRALVAEHSGTEFECFFTSTNPALCHCAFSRLGRSSKVSWKATTRRCAPANRKFRGSS